MHPYLRTVLRFHSQPVKYILILIKNHQSLGLFKKNTSLNLITLDRQNVLLVPHILNSDLVFIIAWLKPVQIILNLHVPEKIRLKQKCRGSQGKHSTQRGCEQKTWTYRLGNLNMTTFWQHLVFDSLWTLFIVLAMELTTGGIYEKGLGYVVSIVCVQRER